MVGSLTLKTPSVVYNHNGILLTINNFRPTPNTAVLRFPFVIITHPPEWPVQLCTTTSCRSVHNAVRTSSRKQPRKQYASCPSWQSCGGSHGERTTVAPRTQARLTTVGDTGTLRRGRRVGASNGFVFLRGTRHTRARVRSVTLPTLSRRSLVLPPARVGRQVPGDGAFPRSRGDPPSSPARSLLDRARSHTLARHELALSTIAFVYGIVGIRFFFFFSHNFFSFFSRTHTHHIVVFHTPK